MMIYVLRVRIPIYWNIPSYYVLQMLEFYHKILSWFNVSHNTSINLSPEQILLQKSIPGPINDNLRRRLDLLLLFIKKYVKKLYSLKINKMPITCTQFINN